MVFTDCDSMEKRQLKKEVLSAKLWYKWREREREKKINGTILALIIPRENVGKGEMTQREIGREKRTKLLVRKGHDTLVFKITFVSLRNVRHIDWWLATLLHQYRTWWMINMFNRRWANLFSHVNKIHLKTNLCNVNGSFNSTLAQMTPAKLGC